MNKEKSEKLSEHEDIYKAIHSIRHDIIIIHITIIFMFVVLGALIILD